MGFCVGSGANRKMMRIAQLFCHDMLLANLAAPSARSYMGV
jgi:hypothetical protein